MAMTYDTSLTANTAHLIGADLGVPVGRVGSAWYAMRGPVGPRTAIVEASRAANLDALAARSAG